MTVLSRVPLRLPLASGTSRDLLPSLYPSTRTLPLRSTCCRWFPLLPPPSSFLLPHARCSLTLAVSFASFPYYDLVVAIRRSAADGRRSYHRRCLLYLHSSLFSSPLFFPFFIIIISAVSDRRSDSWCSLGNSNVFFFLRPDETWLTKANAGGPLVCSAILGSDTIIGIIMRSEADLARDDLGFKPSR